MNIEDRTVRYYICEGCKREYLDEPDAKECEESHPVKFVVGDNVFYQKESCIDRLGVVFSVCNFLNHSEDEYLVEFSNGERIWCGVSKLRLNRNIKK